MKRFAITAFALAGLSACDTGVTSERPLFMPGADLPRAGLWAILENDACPTPGDASVQTWSGCAMPLWVSADRVSYVAVARTNSRFVLAEGRPAIAQLEPEAGWSPPFFESLKGGDQKPQAPDHKLESKEYSYMAVQAEGASPFVRARVWVLPCPQDDRAGFGSFGSDENCSALTAQAVRAVAAQTVGSGKGYAAVWVAP